MAFRSSANESHGARDRGAFPCLRCRDDAGKHTRAGIKLGTAGVLFAAILTGHFGKPIDRHTLEFVKEFGLILFVFCIGLQIGPGFFASLRRAGLRLNAMALAIVLSGGLLVATLGWLFGFDAAAIPGIFSGATTNTPSLGAAQQTLASFPNITETMNLLSDAER